MITKTTIKAVLNGQDFQTIKQIAEVYKRFEITKEGYVRVYLGNCAVDMGKTDNGYRVARVEKIETKDK